MREVQVVTRLGKANDKLSRVCSAIWQIIPYDDPSHLTTPERIVSINRKRLRRVFEQHGFTSEGLSECLTRRMGAKAATRFEARLFIWC